MPGDDPSQYGRLTAEDVWKHPVPSREQVLALPVSVPFAQAARALGYGRDTAYREVGNWPTDVPLLALGKGTQKQRKVCRRSDLLKYLGITEETRRAG